MSEQAALTPTTVTTPTAPSSLSAALGGLADRRGGARQALTGVAGDGRLAGAIADLLGFRADRLGTAALATIGANGGHRDPFAALGVVIVASDGWDQRHHTEVRERCARAGIAWLPVRVDLGRAVIGPAERDGVPGCVACAEVRAMAAQPAPGIRAELLARHDEHLAAPSAWLTAPAVMSVAELAVAEAQAMMTQQASGRVLHIELDSLRTGVHRFLPYPQCPVCGHLPPDTPTAATLRHRAVPKPTPDAYRVRDLDDLADPLMSAYVDREVGLVREVTGRPDSLFPLGMAPFGYPETTLTESGWGRTGSFRVSRLSALLEALERIGGARPSGKATVVRASYRELAGRALDPESLGLFPPERYERPEFPFQRYHDGLTMNWVWGYSFAHGGPLLVPESYAYYRTTMYAPQEQMFVYEISNGCALGGCIEEAILHGLLEVAERDAFLMTWYGRMPVPEVDIGSARDRGIPLLVERIQRRTGMTVHAFDITVEQRVPCSWVMVVDDDRPDNPKVLCAAGAATDPERALATALHELGPMLSSSNQVYASRRAHIDRMVADPSHVREMEDHSLLYSSREVFDRFSFLLGRPTRPIGDLWGQCAWPRYSDLADDLAEMVGRYTESGLDVIVVDQTTAEHRVLGLSCVKVIVPGTLPMTFGYAHRRTDGIPRVLSVPHLLGYADRPLDPADLNPHPHPFP